MHNYEDTEKKNIINKLICNVFFSCFHNYLTKNAFAEHVLFSHFWSQIMIIIIIIMIIILMFIPNRLVSVVFYNNNI